MSDCNATSWKTFSEKIKKEKLFQNLKYIDYIFLATACNNLKFNILYCELKLSVVFYMN